MRKEKGDHQYGRRQLLYQGKPKQRFFSFLCRIAVDGTQPSTAFSAFLARASQSQLDNWNLTGASTALPTRPLVGCCARLRPPIGRSGCSPVCVSYLGACRRRRGCRPEPDLKCQPGTAAAQADPKVGRRSGLPARLIYKARLGKQGQLSFTTAVAIHHPVAMKSFVSYYLFIILLYYPFWGNQLIIKCL